MRVAGTLQASEEEVERITLTNLKNLALQIEEFTIFQGTLILSFIRKSNLSAFTWFSELESD